MKGENLSKIRSWELKLVAVKVKCSYCYLSLKAQSRTRPSDLYPFFVTSSHKSIIVDEYILKINVKRFIFY